MMKDSVNAYVCCIKCSFPNRVRFQFGNFEFILCAWEEIHQLKNALKIFINIYLMIKEMPKKYENINEYSTHITYTNIIHI